jgi:hypothetical protein
MYTHPRGNLHNARTPEEKRLSPRGSQGGGGNPGEGHANEELFARPWGKCRDTDQFTQTGGKNEDEDQLSEDVAHLLEDIDQLLIQTGGKHEAVDQLFTQTGGKIRTGTR